MRKKTLGDLLLDIINERPLCARCGEPIIGSYLGGSLCEDCTVSDYVRWKARGTIVALPYLAVSEKTT
jgi:hypothetical protein